MSTRSRGFTLVEALVALLVLSVGMLGAWSLQLSSLRAHNDALQQAAAAELLRDMAERIRANVAAGFRYASAHTSAPATGCTAATSCSAEQLAAVDVAWFAARAAALFPGGDTATRVEFVPATGPADADDVAVSLQWRGARARQSATLHVPAPPVAG